MAAFIQNTFNEISLERDQELWLDADDSRLEDRLRLLSEFPQCHFRQQGGNSIDSGHFSDRFLGLLLGTLFNGGYKMARNVCFWTVLHKYNLFKCHLGPFFGQKNTILN